MFVFEKLTKLFQDSYFRISDLVHIKYVSLAYAVIKAFMILKRKRLSEFSLRNVVTREY